MNAITQLEPVDYLVIGHITRDLTQAGPKIGGTAAYSALTAKAIGAKVGIVTSWGCEIPAHSLVGIKIINHPVENSTTFENIYTPGGRLQVIHNLAGPLNGNSIPNRWLNTPIVHLGPIAGEVAPKLASLFPNSMVGVTPQGWFRSWDENGHIHPTRWNQAEEVLSKAEAVVLSTEDVGGDEEIIEEMAALSPVFVVTEGYSGARVFWHGDVRRLHAPDVDEVDATGAGDIFSAAFFTQYHKTRNPWEAARFANLLASKSVTREGLLSVPTQEEIKNALIEVI
jgi:sugar/nucleoside kinase (ribokinase family)